MPLALSDDQLEQVKAAARALPYRLRDQYLHALSKLLDSPRLTPATVERACAQAQQHTLGLHALQPTTISGIDYNQNIKIGRRLSVRLLTYAFYVQPHTESAPKRRMPTQRR